MFSRTDRCGNAWAAGDALAFANASMALVPHGRPVWPSGNDPSESRLHERKSTVWTVKSALFLSPCNERFSFASPAWYNIVFPCWFSTRRIWIISTTGSQWVRTEESLRPSRFALGRIVFGDEMTVGHFDEPRHILLGIGIIDAPGLEEHQR